MAPYALLLLPVAAAIGGVVGAKWLDQRRRDRNRTTYVLQFPAELDADSLTSWIRSISGTLRASHSRLAGVPTVAFELWATEKGIVHRLKVPWQHEDFVVSQLRTLVPGMRVLPEDEFPRRQWVSSVEVGLTHTSRPLRIYNASAVSASLLASMQALKEHETVVMQWVITPAVPTHKPIYGEAKTHRVGVHQLLYGAEANRDEVKERRDKLDEPNVMAVLRVAAVADTPVRANHLIYRLRAALASTRSASTRFNKRWVSKTALQRRIDTTASSLLFPMQLSAPELAALVAWPIGNPFVSGLPQALSRQLPAPESVPRDGRVLGRSNFPGNERPIAMSFEDARKHVHVLGPTGTGKTALLANMLRQDIWAGYGVILIEAKGDLFHSALDYIPRERLNDVIVMDVNDRRFPVGFNVLQQGDPQVVIDELGALFDYLYRDTRSVWTREALYFGLQTLISTPGTAFTDLPALLAPRAHEVKWADQMRNNARDPDVQRFWQRIENQNKAAQDRFMQPLLDRIWQLAGRAEIRNIIGQPESSFQMTDVLRDHKILLTNLSGLPRETANLMGTLVNNALWHAAKTTPVDRPNFLYLDEFQDFLNLPIDPEDMLAKARSFGLGMTLAHQHLAQLAPEMKSAILANARTKVAFQTSSDDARALAREFGRDVTDHDFMHLGRFEAWTRVATNDGVSPPLSMTTNPPSAALGLAREVIESSRSKYGRPIEEVRKAADDRYGQAPAPWAPRPSIGNLPNIIDD